jgi:hypothetical protein
MILRKEMCLNVNCVPQSSERMPEFSSVVVMWLSDLRGEFVRSLVSG